MTQISLPSDFSLWTKDDLVQWLDSLNLSKYRNSFLSHGITGYDLCYLTNEDFKSLGINTIHDKSILVKSIRTLALDELKLHFNYDNKPCSIQLDFDANCSVGDVIIQLKEIYQIPPDKQIQLSTYDNDILAYNIKLAELIILNPHKYKKLQIVNSYKIYKGNYEQSSSLALKEVPKIEYDGTISRYSDDSKNNEGKLKHRRNHNVNLPSTYRTNNDGNNFYYENKTGDDNNNEEQHHLVNNYYSNRNNNDTITNTNNINNRSNSFNYNQAPMNNYNRPFNYKYSHINNNSDTNEDLLYNNNNNNNTIDIYPRPNTSNTFHSHWNIHNASHI